MRERGHSDALGRSTLIDRPDPITFGLNLHDASCGSWPVSATKMVLSSSQNRQS